MQSFGLVWWIGGEFGVIVMCGVMCVVWWLSDYGSGLIGVLAVICVVVVFELLGV